MEVIPRELFEASASTADVLDLLRMRTAHGNLLLPQVGVADPNASTATAEHGAELMGDLPRVKILLRNEWLSESGANRVSVRNGAVSANDDGDAEGKKIRCDGWNGDS